MLNLKPCSEEIVSDRSEVTVSTLSRKFQRTLYNLTCFIALENIYILT